MLRTIPRHALVLGLLYWVTCATAGAATTPDDRTNRYIVVLNSHAVEVASFASGPLVQPRVNHRMVVVEDGLAAPSAIAPGRQRALQAVSSAVFALSTDLEVDIVYDSVFPGFAAELTPEQVGELEAMGLVDEVVPDTMVTPSTKDCRSGLSGAPCSQNLPAYFSWGLERIDQPAPASWGRSYFAQRRGRGVTAFVIDSGLRETHEEFRFPVTAWWSAYDNSYADCLGHGTHVSSTIGGVAYGVAKQVRLVPMRVFRCEDGAPSSIVISALDAIHRSVTTNPAAWLPAVANMSLGGAANSAEDHAVRQVIAAGVTVVVAAGNETQDSCNTSPARVAEAITVAASTSGDEPASFSNYGSCVDLYAPGRWILGAGIENDRQVIAYSGTSMASPHVAGVVALYLDADTTSSPVPPVPADATPAQVHAAIVSRAWQGVLSGDLKGSPNLLLSSRWGDLAAPTCVTDVLVPSDPGKRLYISGYDCQASPMGSGFYAQSFTVPAAAGQELSFWTVGRGGFSPVLMLVAPDGTVQLRGERFSIVPPVAGNYTLWVSSWPSWQTGEALVHVEAAGAPLPLEQISSEVTEAPDRLVTSRGTYLWRFRFVNDGPPANGVALKMSIHGADLSAQALESAEASCDLTLGRCVVPSWPTGQAVEVTVRAKTLGPGPGSLVVGNALTDYDVLPGLELVGFGKPAAGTIPVRRVDPSDPLDSEAALDLAPGPGLVDWAFDRMVLGGAPMTGATLTGASLDVTIDSEGLPGTAPACAGIPSSTKQGSTLELLFEDACRLDERSVHVRPVLTLDPEDSTWQWGTETVQHGAPDLWRQPLGTNAACWDWAPLGTCVGTTGEDLRFRVDGWSAPANTRTSGLDLTALGADVLGAVATPSGWALAIQQGQGRPLAIQRLDEAGATVGAPVEIFPAVLDGALASDGVGALLVVGLEGTSPDEPAQVSARSLAPDGTLSDRTAFASLSWPSDPRVACLGGGECLITWIDTFVDQQPPRRRATAVPITSNAEVTGGPVTLGTQHAGGFQGLDVATRPGGFVATWARNGVWTRTVMPDGRLAGPLTRIDEPQVGRTVSKPRTVTAADGTLVTAWLSAEMVQGTLTHEVRAQVLAPDGSRCNHELLARRLDSDPTRPVPLDDTGGIGLVVTESLTPGDPARWTVAWTGDGRFEPYHFARQGETCRLAELPFHLLDGPGGFSRPKPIMASRGISVLAGAVTQRPVGADRFEARLLSEGDRIELGTLVQGRFRGPADITTWRSFRSVHPAQRVQLHRLTTGATAGSLVVTVRQDPTGRGPSHLDLAVGRGSTASTATVVCRSQQPGSLDERCEVAVGANEAWWVAVERLGTAGVRYVIDASVE